MLPRSWECRRTGFIAISGFASLLFLTSAWAGTFVFVKRISRSGSTSWSGTQSEWVQRDRLPKDREKDATPEGRARLGQEGWQDPANVGRLLQCVRPPSRRDGETPPPVAHPRSLRQYDEERGDG